MRSSQVTFKNADVPMHDLASGEETKQMEIIEITYPDGKVIGFPAQDKSPETGRKYCEMYPAKYAAFKNGEPDPDRVDALQREIAEKQAELDGLAPKPKDDRRIQENLGYGGMNSDGGPSNALVPHEKFKTMSKAELREWIEANSDQKPATNASHSTLVEMAEKIEGAHAENKALA